MVLPLLIQLVDDNPNHLDVLCIYTSMRWCAGVSTSNLPPVLGANLPPILRIHLPLTHFPAPAIFEVNLKRPTFFHTPTIIIVAGIVLKWWCFNVCGAIWLKHLDGFIVDNVYMLSTRFVSRYVEDTALTRVEFHLLSSFPCGSVSRSREGLLPLHC